MKHDYYSNSKDYINRWVISYADLVTLLLALFMVLYASSILEKNKIVELKNKVEKIFISKEVLKEQENNKIIKGLTESLSEKNNITYSVKSDKKGVIIRINNNTLFDEGSAEIKKEALKNLKQIATYLTTIDNHVIIEGHTDSTPIHNDKFKSNWALSTARATNIIEYLITNYNIPPQKLSAQGYGEFKPIETNNTPKGREQNRRVDIVIQNTVK